MEINKYLKFYSDRGWKIFPCRPKDKTPLVKWQDEATNDMRKIEAWWSQYPDANVGLATGKRSGLFALDIDAGHGGVETLNHLIQKYGQLPNTPMSNTGGGGYHYLFSYTTEVRNTASKIGAGIDTRGDGGYIVVPPSLHPSGKNYEWDKSHAPSVTELSPAPQWLLQLLNSESQTPQPLPGQGIYHSGMRNSTLMSLAGSMRRRGMDNESIFLALNAENLNKCVPPLPEKEVRALVESVMRYNPQAEPVMLPRDRVTAEWAFAKTVFEVPEYIQDHLDIQPNYFSSKQLEEFWQDVVNGTGVAQAAANSEILADLESYTEWFLPRIETYAETIKHYAYRDKAARLGWRLQKAAEEGNESKIDNVVLEINQNITLQNTHKTVSMLEAVEELESQVEQRRKTPVDVWGIPYAWPYISKLTGGKQLGELILLAGEPGIGKSYWALQDGLETAVTHHEPVFIWSGEMKANQIVRRFYQLLGVDGRNMRTGRVTTQDIERMNDAKALILNSPIFIDDKPLKLHELRGVMQYQKSKNGIRHFILDYAFLIDAPGKDEIEKTSNVSKVVKGVCHELDLSGLLIASVNKMGMDTEKTTKANIRGSGQQIHDADIVYTLTSFAQVKNDRVALRYSPNDYDKLVSLHIKKGRELDHTLPGGVLHFSRMNSAKFQEELQDKKS